MAIAVNDIYKVFQQTRDVMPDEVYYNIFQSTDKNVEIENQIKEQYVQNIVTFAKEQVQSNRTTSLRFKTLVDPF